MLLLLMMMMIIMMTIMTMMAMTNQFSEATCKADVGEQVELTWGGPQLSNLPSEDLKHRPRPQKEGKIRGKIRS
jgi:hypothetical protein